LWLFEDEPPDERLTAFAVDRNRGKSPGAQVQQTPDFVVIP
jgi:hypothetical protein